MTTHLYTLCWNEADMLEFFFRNYDPWVDRYIVYDDGSTDGSIEILKSHPRVELRNWRRKFPDSYLISQIDWLNEVWKESRGCADWAVIVDIDEHLFVPQFPMQDLLERYKSQGITLVPALGFQMLSEEFPKAHEHLVQTRTWGTPWKWMCKLSIFNPDAIEETNFTGGRHNSNCSGHLKLAQRDELHLFHYKYLDFERTYEKQSLHYKNLGEIDAATGLILSKQKRRKNWDDFLKKSGDMSWPNFNPDNYPYFYRWWRLRFFSYVSQWFDRFKKFARNPGYMIKRLKFCITSKDDYQYRHKFGLFIEKINQSPIRKEIYRLIIKGEANGNGGNTVVASNGKGERGAIIQCLRSLDTDTLQGSNGIQEVISVKEVNKKKFQKEFDAFVITNCNGFEKNAVKFAKRNGVKLVSRKDLIEFISQIKVS